MLIDCHLHTRPSSSCSLIAPETACERAMAHGLDALVFTEHHLRAGTTELDHLRRLYPALSLYSGMEVSLREGFDLIIISSELERRIPPFLSFNSLTKHLAPYRDRAFVFLPHAFRYTERMDAALEDILSYVDGLEMNSINILRSGHVVRQAGFLPRALALYEKAQQDYALIPLYNSDGHAPDWIGSICNEVETQAPPGSEDGLAELLKRSKPGQRQNADLLAQIFE